MQDKQKTTEPNAKARELDLDRDRSASMAFEGGTAAAETELKEALRSQHSSGALAIRRENPKSWWGSRILWSALAVGAAAALLTRFALRWKRR